MERARNIFLISFGVVLLQLAIYYPQMPPVLASHFDGAGQPNGWMTRNVFFAFWLGMMGILAVSFLWLPAKAWSYRTQKWSLPNLEYWLAPIRKQETIEFLHARVLWFGVMNNGFMLAIGQLVFEANLNAAPVLDGVVTWLLIGYFAYTIVWLILLFAHFARVPHGGASRPV